MQTCCDPPTAAGVGRGEPGGRCSSAKLGGGLLPTARWAQGCRHWGGQRRSCLLLALSDFLIDFVPVPLAGCTATLPENHFSNLKKINGLTGHCKCPRASPTTAACREGAPSPIQGSHPTDSPTMGSGAPLFRLPALYTSIPSLGERRGLLERAPRGDVSGTRLVPRCRGSDAVAGARAPASVIPQGMDKGNRLHSGAREGKRFAEPPSGVTRA